MVVSQALGVAGSGSGVLWFMLFVCSVEGHRSGSPGGRCGERGPSPVCQDEAKAKIRQLTMMPLATKLVA
jgi:hypothetical protein